MVTPRNSQIKYLINSNNLAHKDTFKYTSVKKQCPVNKINKA